MPEYRYDHIHLRSLDPNVTAHFFEAMFGLAEDAARSLERLLDASR